MFDAIFLSVKPLQIKNLYVPHFVANLITFKLCINRKIALA